MNSARVVLIQVALRCVPFAMAATAAAVHDVRSAAAQPADPSRPADVLVVTDPAGGEVRIDGDLVPGSPARKRGLLPGDHLIEVSWPGGGKAQQIVKVEPGTAAVVKLSPQSPPAPTPAPAPACHTFTALLESGVLG